MTGKPTLKQAKQAALKIHARIIVAKHGTNGCQAAATGVVDTPCTNDGNLQCAHIISRRYDATSTHLANAWALCPGHHRQVDTRPLLWATLVHETVGMRHVHALNRLEVSGSRLKFWRTRLAFLVCCADTLEVDLDGIPKGPILWARNQTTITRHDS